MMVLLFYAVASVKQQNHIVYLLRSTTSSQIETRRIREGGHGETGTQRQGHLRGRVSHASPHNGGNPRKRLARLEEPVRWTGFPACSLYCKAEPVPRWA